MSVDDTPDPSGLPEDFLIEQDERSRGSIVQDVGRLIHLDEKRALARRQVI